MSRLFLRTLREDPADAEFRNHKLLVRAGYIRRVAPGGFAWLPLGLRVKAKIETVVREEMDAAGAQEVHFPALLSAEPYKTTGRYADYGDDIFTLEDRKGVEYVLAPTHEEAFALLVKDLYSSYKDLPLSIYQIQEKFRDETRPRAGLMRGREFTMKDAYSFDIDDEGLDASYDLQRAAYERVFRRLGLEYAIVSAHAGAMGGSRSEEFLHPTPIGDDTFVRSSGGYAANVEAFRTLPPAPREIAGLPAATVFDSPDTPTIATLVALLNDRHPRGDGREWTAADTLKNVVLALTHTNGERELVVVGIPGDRDADLKRAEAAFFPAAVEAATEADFAAHPVLVKGYIGPWSAAGPVLGGSSTSGIRFLVDPRVVEGTEWVTGANEPERHVLSLVAGRDFENDGVAEVAEVRAGDPAPDGSGPIELARGTELGHVFALGRKYADALGLQVLDRNGKLVTVTMGSYGIGISRVMALLAEANSDDKGLAWPRSVAPFDALIVAAGKDEALFEAAERIGRELEQRGADVLVDDRRISPGVKFKDAELIGVPTVVVVGRGLTDGVVEVWDRAADTRSEVALVSVVDRVAALLEG
ncbi:MAG: proline--tRNA ligase [Acidobacteria bacterium]|nr:proline--tRNA ligase [Acidobacteriota bacterium]